MRIDLPRRTIASALLAVSAPGLWPATADVTSTADLASGTAKPTVDLNKGGSAVVTSKCFMDVSIGGAPAGRLVIDLYGGIAPRAAENFRALCTGEKGFGYAGSSFYRVIDGLTLQGGNIPPDGKALQCVAPLPKACTEGRSIYGPTFAHDNYDLAHSVVGLVSMANSGKGGYSGESDSRFLIQLKDDAGYLDGRYAGFGRVVEGMDIVRKIEQEPVQGQKNAPVKPITIDAAGELKPPPPPEPPADAA